MVKLGLRPQTVPIRPFGYTPFAKKDAQKSRNVRSGAVFQDLTGIIIYIGGGLAQMGPACRPPPPVRQAGVRSAGRQGASRT